MGENAGKLKTIIIDDESRVRDALEGLLKKHCPNVLIVEKAKDVRSGIEAVKKHLPDLVLLDIRMPDGDGFDLLKQVSHIPFKLIFITAYEEHAVKAFKFSAIDYLLKPIDPDDLIKAIQKAEDVIAKDNTALRLSSLIDNLNGLPKDRKIVLKTSDAVHLVAMNEIIRCESQGSYTELFLQGEKKILVSRSLKEFDEMLNEFGFIRVHKTHLINATYIEQFKKLQGGFVILKDGSSIPVSSRKKDYVLQYIERTLSYRPR